MDMRTGRTYETKEAALAAGVPGSDIAEIIGDPADGHAGAGEIVRFSSGPFKNRVYQRAANGQLVRVKGGRGWIEKNDGAGQPIRVRR
jgi:hypothetical protein